MTTKIYDGNEKIANLLGMQETKIGWYDSEENLHLSYTNDNTFDNLLFHESWDWLHSAVDFIMSIENGIFQVDILQEGCKILKRCNKFIDMTVSKLPAETTQKMAVWMAVVEFCDWYEKNKPKEDEDETKVKKVLFGSMTFLEEQFDGVFKTIVHRIDSVQYLTEEQANDVIDGEDYDCYFIPDYYKGEVVYECEKQ